MFMYAVLQTGCVDRDEFFTKKAQYYVDNHRTVSVYCGADHADLITCSMCTTRMGKVQAHVAWHGSITGTAASQQLGLDNT
jgi:hypothetical protein